MNIARLGVLEISHITPPHRSERPGLLRCRHGARDQGQPGLYGPGHCPAGPEAPTADPEIACRARNPATATSLTPS
ncbi:hypothetical protein [Arthrobacter sp. H35-D1]|uniref:hypothetical protein n=1 Tax=Arthrobacter sp. H35-D1 TaxID=3046202 RepID=UPI0024BA7952|nr:hypothetical protein [Arthrobacter sp. H35-D1]MDJ0313812.1 hypothetical protein [Arthrobacter sp. H35-D1]